mmetsp:Transcript_50477/g.107788  ORF Transcript_50477/g.107788 Transcript_50477/m.107788 type:complete len:220 (-) Transcript_50477:541-1200(-)
MAVVVAVDAVAGTTAEADVAAAAMLVDLPLDGDASDTHRCALSGVVGARPSRGRLSPRAGWPAWPRGAAPRYDLAPLEGGACGFAACECLRFVIALLPRGEVDSETISMSHLVAVSILRLAYLIRFFCSRPRTALAASVISRSACWSIAMESASNSSAGRASMPSVDSSKSDAPRAVAVSGLVHAVSSRNASSAMESHSGSSPPSWACAASSVASAPSA